MLGPIGIGFGFSAIFFVWYLIGSLIFSYLIKRSGENPFEIIKNHHSNLIFYQEWLLSLHFF